MKCAKSVLALVLFASNAGAEVSHEEVRQLAFRFFPKQFRECSEYADWEAAAKATLEDVDPWEQFPVAIVRGNWWWDFENGVPEDWAKDSVANRFFGGSRYVVYLPMRFPGDPNEYLMLCYNNFGKSFWLWLRRAPGKDWEQVQSSGMFLEYLAGEGYGGVLFAEPLYPWPADIDGDNFPEILLCVDGHCSDSHWLSGRVIREPRGLMVYKFKNGKLEAITPICTGETICPPGNPSGDTGRNIPDPDHPTVCGWEIHSPEIGTRGDSLMIRDLDGDGVAEIIAPHHLRNWDEEIDGSWQAQGGGPNEAPCRDCVEVGTIRVYKLIKGRYTLWREFQHTWQFEEALAPKVALAVTEPASFTTKELESASGQGMLRVFVSMPSIGETLTGEVKTVDDYETDSFREQVGNTRLVFVKRWQNKKYPAVLEANDVVDGVWVSLEGRQQCGIWQVNPSEPGYPHPEQCVQYAFVGDYLEFRLPLSAVREYLLTQAKKLLGEKPGQKGPELERDRVFVRIPMVGKMKDGKQVEVHALVEVRKVPVGM